MDENYGQTKDSGLAELDKAIEYIKLRGFSRVQIVNQDGSVHGDSGFLKNQITNDGVNDYLAQLLGGMGGSKVITHVALGTGTEPGASATSLEGEVEARTAITAASSNTKMKLRITATFASGGNFVTTTMSLKNIGLFNTSSGGTIFAGNTYGTSTCATNQNVQVTYDIDFSTS